MSCQKILVHLLIYYLQCFCGRKRIRKVSIHMGLKDSLPSFVRKTYRVWMSSLNLVFLPCLGVLVILSYSLKSKEFGISPDSWGICICIFFLRKCSHHPHHHGSSVWLHLLNLSSTKWHPGEADPAEPLSACSMARF